MFVLKECKGNEICIIKKYKSKLHNVWRDNLPNVCSIYYKNKVVGFISYGLYTPYKNKKHYQLYIYMVEVLPQYRYRGLGKQLIKSLLFDSNMFQGKCIMSITGEALAEAIYFWYDLGANFEKTINKLEIDIQNGYSAAFYLSKRGFRYK